MRLRVLFLTVACLIGTAAAAYADETDNFTCRTRSLRDSLVSLDLIMNARIQAAVARANQRVRTRGCDDECLARELQAAVSATYLHPLTLVPHASFERWITRNREIDRCRLAFRDTIYGARPFNQPWLFPITGRIIFVADSIRIGETIVGLDKINHFIREGLAHWKDSRRPGTSIEHIMKKELGSAGRQFHWNEYGLKGWSLTGVLSYADLAAGYSGFRFWSDVSTTDRPLSIVARDLRTGEFVIRRPFTFADYVNDAWDEGINCSAFQPRLARLVAAALSKRSMTCPAAAAASLAALPDARLYVNPRYLMTMAIPDVQ